jgi:hypothetical protein
MKLAYKRLSMHATEPSPSSFLHETCMKEALHTFFSIILLACKAKNQKQKIQMKFSYKQAPCMSHEQTEHMRNIACLLACIHGEESKPMLLLPTITSWL